MPARIEGRRLPVPAARPVVVGASAPPPPKELPRPRSKGDLPTSDRGIVGRPVLWWAAMFGIAIFVAALAVDAQLQAPPPVGAPAKVVARSYGAMGTEVVFSIFTTDATKAD